MKIHTSIGFLLLSGVVGVLLTDTHAEDLYVLDDNDVPVKVDLTETDSTPSVQIHDMPKRVLFYLYTQANKKKPDKLKVGDVAGLRNSHFNAGRPTKFVTHGWVNSYKSKACTLVRDAFLRNGDYNVIVVDWSHITKRPYIWASNHVVKVGQYVARMIDFLKSQGVDSSQVTVVGHSLGAHVAGLSSYYASNKANYVVALDPAGPNFYLSGQGSKVSKNDAAYVEVIHTSKLLGISSSLGHSDFYPNGGTAQNGCKVDLGGSCSHSRSYMYYAESINNGGFLARHCNSFADFLSNKCNSKDIARMGGVSPKFNVNGKYFLTTNSKSPFAKNRVV